MNNQSEVLKPKGHKMAIIALAASLLLALLPAIFIHKLCSEGDVFTHYYISLQAWKNPLLILDLWGRPLFTLTTMPFALAGFQWMKVYSIILGTLTAWLAYLSVRKLAFSEAWVAIPFVIFTPVYYYLLFNPLTETLMAFLLVLSVYLFIEKKYDLSALVVGFMPFARLEAFVIFPVFIVIFLIKKKIRPVFLLLGGYFFFGLIGYLVFGDFLWFISKNPYSGGATDIYGKGELLHFIYKTDSILGYPMAFLFTAGIIIWGFKIWQLRRSWANMGEEFSAWLLLTGTYIVYLSAHSYSWWSGKGNSLGLIRVMGAVTPLAAMMAAAGLHFISMELGKFKIKDKMLALAFVLVIALPTLKKYLPYQPSYEEIEVSRASEWLKSNNLLDRKIYYFHPLAGILTNRGAFEDEKGAMKVHFAGFQPDETDPGALILWDAHFGPNEGQTPLELLLENPAYRLLVEIKPEIPFKTLGNQDFRICIFERNKDFKLSGEADSSLNWLVLRKEGFEQPMEKKLRKQIDSTEVHSGRYSHFMSEKEEFYEFFNTKLQTLDLRGSDSTLRASVWIKPEKESSEMAALVADLKMEKSNRYISVPLANAKSSENGWRYLEVMVDLKGAKSMDQLKVYVWNKGKIQLRIDDFVLGLGMPAQQ